MKAPLLTKLFTSTSTRTAALVCCLTFLLASVRTGQAQFVLATGTGYTTNCYNFFATNCTTLAVDETNVAPPLSGQPSPEGNLCSLYSSGKISGVIPADGLVTVNATAVNGSASFTLGSNPTGAGMTLTLNNPNTLPEEVRLDWTADYQNNGSATRIIGFTANISGTGSGAGSYYALAGAETISPLPSWLPYTAALNNNGFNNSDLGAGPWYGESGLDAYSANTTALFSGGGPIIASGQHFNVLGYLDLVVDPGTVQVQLESVSAPALGIGIYSNLPVVYFPTATGTNFVVQMSTNLASGGWVAVTNGVPFSGLQFTNAPSPAFFRLQ